MKSKPIQLRASLWMMVGEENFGGVGRMSLLTQIAETGSITQAARAMRMSYKAAWDAVDMMNNLAGEPLVERQVGGKGGGGTALTARGKQLVENFERIKREHQHFVEQLNAQINAIADIPVQVTRVGMKTSARNQFPGWVASIAPEGDSDAITVDTGNGMKLVATITKESTHDLKLTPGDEVMALLKAPAVQIRSVGSGDEDAALAENCFAGEVEQLIVGDNKTEVVVRLPNGERLCALVSAEQCVELNVGQKVIASFSPASVLLGVPV